MFIIEFFSQPIWERLGLTLMHFIWQGLAVAVLLGIFMGLFRFRSGNIRYAVYLSAFLFMLTCPIMTFCLIDMPVEDNPIPLTGQEYTKLMELPVENQNQYSGYIFQDIETANSNVSITPITKETVPLHERMTNYFYSFLPWAIAAWLVGVIALSLRLLLGFVGICRWRRQLETPSANLQQRIKCLCQKLGMPNFSRVFISHGALQAMAVGYFRPMVLLPAAIITQMPPEMLEAVMAHELAHIRRFDLWVNLLQRIAETLLFYHPAMWWLSGRLRNERELCCDEIAAQVIGEKVTYARTLEYVSHLQLGTRPQILAAGMAQGNKPILNRVRHILGMAAPPHNNRFWAAGIITALILIGLITPAAFLVRAQAEDDQSVVSRKEVAPSGLIDRLPPDGTWARFEMKKYWKGEISHEGTLTIASVGKVRVNDRPCRWLEIILEEYPVEMDWFKMWIKQKVLVPENLVGKNHNLLENAEALWKITFQDNKPFNINGLKEGNEQTSLVPILAGPDRQVERLAQQKISTGLGDFTCKGWSGHRIIKVSYMVDDTAAIKPTKVSYRQWSHEKSPFGVIRAEIEIENYNSANKVIHFTFAETGQNAQAQISLADIPLEKQIARPLAPAAGWWWISQPMFPFSLGTLNSSGISTRAEKSDDGLVINMAHPKADEQYSYRPVAFDTELNRYDFKFNNSVGSYAVTLSKFTLDNDIIAHDKIAWLGVEKKLEPETSAPVSLIDKSIPDIEPLNLKLPKADVENKPLLLCFFDMNQRPSRNCITELAKKYEALRPKGITIAAVQTSDVDWKSLQDWVTQNNIPFPVGRIEGNEEKTKLNWGVQSLPWLILTDKNHVVRAEGFGFDELDKIIRGINLVKIQGVVQDATGTPVTGAVVRMIPTLGSKKVRTDAEGKFEIFWDKSHREAAYDNIVNAVVEQKPGKLLVRQVERNLVALIDIDEEIQIQEIELKEGITLSGEVTVKDIYWEGNFHADISVGMMVSRWLIPLTEPNMVTDAMGRYQLRALTAEQGYYLEAAKKGFGRVTAVVQGYDAVENRLEAPDLVLPVANQSVSGMVVGEDDQPIADVLVRISGANQPFLSVKTDAEGKFTIDQICPGWLQITTHTSGPEDLYGRVIVDAGDMDVKIIVKNSKTEEPKSLMGLPLPELKGLNLKISDRNIKDHALLICFWDMQQRPSRNCLTQLAGRAEKLAQKHITVIGIGIESSTEYDATLTSWLRQNKITFPIGLLDIDKDAEKVKFNWGVQALPWLILTDEKHVVQAEGFNLDKLEDLIKNRN